MNKKINYNKIKWGTFLITALILTISIAAIFLMAPKKENAEPAPQVDKIETQEKDIAGYYTNNAFSKLIEENLSDLNFLSNISFSGSSDGQFLIAGILSSPKRLIAACPELKIYSPIIESMENESVEIKGHLSTNEQGNAQLIADTVRVAGHEISGKTVTDYIEKYTALNDLFEVPLDQIKIDSSGVYFTDQIPPSIQIASYNLTLPYREEES